MRPTTEKAADWRSKRTWEITVKKINLVRKIQDFLIGLLMIYSILCTTTNSPMRDHQDSGTKLKIKIVSGSSHCQFNAICSKLNDNIKVRIFHFLKYVFHNLIGALKKFKCSGQSFILVWIPNLKYKSWTDSNSYSQALVVIWSLDVWHILVKSV